MFPAKSTKKSAELPQSSDSSIGPYSLIESIKGIQRITVFDIDGRIMRIPSMWLNTSKFKDSTLALHARNICYIAKGMHACKIYPELPFDKKLHLLNRDNVEAYIDYERDKRLEETTVHSREMTLFNLLKFMNESIGSLHRAMEDGPYRESKKITSGKYLYLPKELSEQQIIALLQNLHNECERAVVHFIIDTGVRIEQVIRITNMSLPDDVAAGGGYLYIRLEANKQRGNRTAEQITLLTTPVLARIQRYHNNDVAYRRRYQSRHASKNLMFLTANGRPWSRQNLTQQMQRAAARAGFNLDAPRMFNRGDGKKKHVQISPHVLRHTFACNVLRSTDLGMDYVARRVLLQECLFHRSLEAGDPYSKMVPKQSAESKRNTFSKYEQAKRIDLATSIPPRKHHEQRGHNAK
ncbi:tyrosine-type recombinase/integrase [Paraburkholderia fungorum]|uniref:tyrosine-type recombinase/integrase n=1 Tax=Paraburkholderia fungorum TaxID=134537 RepID=UPI002092DE1E|nr:tyrosine-type recombinase/integrase [Paraburkholderia fungorum]USU18815.1 tyrosine-type recombinase/integrase [Paraburkholderia fungorum]USU29189.1 tyrosine-type recombinase/integrase [Paraburkholderia fungorum]